MSGVAGSEETDDVLLSRLRAVVERVDPVPDLVRTAARAAFGLRRIDDELAELVRDSADDGSDLLAVRGEGDVRLISFETGPVTVELQVTDRNGNRDLVAQVTGASVVRAEVETPAQRYDTALQDSVATVEGVAAGLLRLHLLTREGRGLVTAWVRV